jgi:diacylglycerol kinase family enzyme
VTRTAVLANLARVRDPAALRRSITAALAQDGWPEPIWLPTSLNGNAEELAHEAVRAGAEVLFAYGGDGTVRAAAGALAGTDVALAVLPSGTGNVLALNLGLPSDVRSGVRLVTRGRCRRRIDVGVVDGMTFTVAAGIGLDAQMLAETSHRAKHRLGWPAYAAAALKHLGGPRFPITLRLDNRPVLEREVRSVLVANVGRLPGGINLLPRALPDDAQLDVVLIAPRWLHEWGTLLLSSMGRHPKGGRLETFRAHRAEVTTEQAQVRELDGDMLPPSRSLVVSVWPSALTVCVPDPANLAASERRSPRQGRASPRSDGRSEAE